MGKRKRAADPIHIDPKPTSTQLRNGTSTTKRVKTGFPRPVTIQIIAGSYERVLHGISATITVDKEGKDQRHEAVEFADTFLLNAHGSAIRCLALSPPSKQNRVTLASGGSDQTINLYQLSAEASTGVRNRGPTLPSLAGRKIVENPKNRELGSLQHHAANVNALKFPTRSKLLSAADDNTIAVARTRDWTILSTIKIPIPKAHGRPSGDTAPLGGTPAGVNDFAIHPSMKLMVSVSKGEKCMRLWNLVTGKKAGVLNFEKLLLQAVGEGRWGRGEGLHVEWDTLGEEFVVGFEKGAVVFGLDSKPKGIVKPSPTSKIHQIHYVDGGIDEQSHAKILVVSTEDGRVIFFSTKSDDSGKIASSDENRHIPVYPVVGEVGGDAESFRSRIKDFEMLSAPGSKSALLSPLIVTASSEGSIVLWSLDLEASLKQLSSRMHPVEPSKGTNGHSVGPYAPTTSPQIGQLLGRYETGNRITCLKAFIMSEAVDEDDTSLAMLGDDEDANGHLEVTSDDSSY
ncbi:MAG: hypothetical protein Q9184_000025 [Pyrenodesmia sp. 2 TL-2023]